MSNKSISVKDAPKLTNRPMSFLPWKNGVEIILQMSGCLNAVTGADQEPGRRGHLPVVTEVAGQPPTLSVSRSIRAGSVPPVAIESITGQALEGELKKDWDRWQSREDMAQAILKSTVSVAVQSDLEDCLTAHEMWTYYLRLHDANLQENQARIRLRLASMRLTGDATAEEMSEHLDAFSVTLDEGREIGLVIPSTDKALMFLDTIMDLRFRWIVSDWKRLDIGQRTWTELKLLYNAESGRRELDKGFQSTKPQTMILTGGRVTGKFDKNKQWKGNKDRFKNGDGKEKDLPKHKSHVNCYRCGEAGHYKNQCKSALSREDRDKDSSGKTYLSAESKVTCIIKPHPALVCYIIYRISNIPVLIVCYA